MATQLTLSKVLEQAIQKEIESRLLYTHLGDKMQDKGIKDTFLDLARQEQGHQNLLERYQQGDFKAGTLSKEEILDYKITEHFDQPEISTDMQLKDVFLYAANREMKAHEFYLCSSRNSSCGRSQNDA
ncbi:ferritin family protein [Chloroflexota bacterium]